MIKNATKCGFYYLSIIVAAILLFASGLIVLAQKKHPKSSGKNSQRVVNKFEPEKQINLKLKECSGEINLPAIGFSGYTLDIDGESITLTGNGGQSVSGEVRAYARSAYWLDANLGLIFGRAKVPLTDPAWKPPTIISLVLMQDRKYPKRF